MNKFEALGKLPPAKPKVSDYWEQVLEFATAIPDEAGGPFPEPVVEVTRAILHGDQAGCSEAIVMELQQVTHPDILSMALALADNVMEIGLNAFRKDLRLWKQYSSGVNEIRYIQDQVNKLGR